MIIVSKNFIIRQGSLATEAVCSRACKQNLAEEHIRQCYWPSTFHVQSKKTFVSIICEEVSDGTTNRKLMWG
jgi:hypothetical protein